MDDDSIALCTRLIEQGYNRRASGHYTTDAMKILNPIPSDKTMPSSLEDLAAQLHEVEVTLKGDETLLVVISVARTDVWRLGGLVWTGDGDRPKVLMFDRGDADGLMSTPAVDADVDTA